MTYAPVVTCKYCGNPATLVKGDVIYPHRSDLYDLNFWQCEPCNAFVGCHKKSKRWNKTGTEPLGRLANAELRTAKSAAHKAFDPMWQSKRCTRSDAYKLLSVLLKIQVEDCHIGNFDIETCNRVVELMSTGMMVCKMPKYV